MSENKKKDFGNLNWGLLSKHRGMLMGLAIIWVILYHGTATDMVLPQKIDVLNILLKRGNNGVDIFLFLSGMGLYFSFYKNSEIGNFYKKRFVRVLIPYAVISGVFWVLQDIVYQKDIVQFLKDFTMISFWTEGIIRTWFIALILPLYLAFPFIYRFLFQKGKRPELRTAVLVAFVMIANWMIAKYVPEWYDKVEIALTRIPVFIVGVLCGKYAKEEKAVTFGEGILLIVLFNFKLFFNMYRVSGWPVRYWYGVLAISVCILFCMIFEIVPKNSLTDGIGKILGFCGKRSLELYLGHIWVRRIFMAADFKYLYNGHDLNKYGLLNYLWIIIFSVLIALIYAWMEKNIFFRKKKGR